MIHVQVHSNSFNFNNDYTVQRSQFHFRLEHAAGMIIRGCNDEISIAVLSMNLEKENRMYIH